MEFWVRTSERGDRGGRGDRDGSGRGSGSSGGNRAGMWRPLSFYGRLECFQIVA